MSLISRSYILDLYPGASFVAALRDAGLDVYMLDWGIPDERDAANGLEPYVDDLLPAAIDAVLASAGTRVAEPDRLLLRRAAVAAARRGHPDLPVASLVTMATPVDPSGMGLFGRMMDRMDPDDLVDDTGNVPPEVIRNAFRVLKPTADLTQYAVLWEKLWDDKQMEAFTVMGQWTRDHIPFPGKAFRETVEVMRGGGLMSGTVQLGDRRIALSDLTWPLLNVIAGKDHIVPSDAAQPVCSLVGSAEAETLELPAGHVGLVMGRRRPRPPCPGSSAGSRATRRRSAHEGRPAERGARRPGAGPHRQGPRVRHQQLRRGRHRARARSRAGCASRAAAAPSRSTRTGRSPGTSPCCRWSAGRPTSGACGSSSTPSAAARASDGRWPAPGCSPASRCSSPSSSWRSSSTRSRDRDVRGARVRARGAAARPRPRPGRRAARPRRARALGRGDLGGMATAGLEDALA